MTCKACGYTDDYKIAREPEHGPGMLPGEKAFIEIGGSYYEKARMRYVERFLRKPTKRPYWQPIPAFACPSCGTLRIKA